MRKIQPVMIHTATLPVVIEVRSTKRDPKAVVVLVRAGARKRKRAAKK